MIGQIYKQLSSFNEAFVHLYDGPPEPEFVATRNLPTSDPRVAEAIMAAVARRSHRVARPVYRFRVFFDPSDRVSGEMMRDITSEVLEGLGAGDLHAVTAGWTNGPSRFLYVIVNRVRPGTFTAWSPWWDMYQMMEILRRLESVHGLRSHPRDRSRARGGERHPGGFRGPPDLIIRKRGRSRLGQEGAIS
jgi:hypothetical protein